VHQAITSVLLSASVHIRLQIIRDETFAAHATNPSYSPDGSSSGLGGLV
jgi:hypothetical protein